MIPTDLVGCQCGIPPGVQIKLVLRPSDLDVRIDAYPVGSAGIETIPKVKVEIEKVELHCPVAGAYGSKILILSILQVSFKTKYFSPMDPQNPWVPYHTFQKSVGSAEPTEPTLTTSLRGRNEPKNL